MTVAGVLELAFESAEICNHVLDRVLHAACLGISTSVQQLPLII